MSCSSCALVVRIISFGIVNDVNVQLVDWKCYGHSKPLIGGNGQNDHGAGNKKGSSMQKLTHAHPFHLSVEVKKKRKWLLSLTYLGNVEHDPFVV